MKRHAQSKSIISLLTLIIIGMASFIYIEHFNEDINLPLQLSFLFEKDNITIVKNIIEKYHQDHTYSKKDLFVCSDMAIDVWNILKSKGFDVKIKIGNINNSTINEKLNFTQYNHAWIMIRIKNNLYALETTRGIIATKSQYPIYYKKTIEFNNPLEFKNYLDMIKKYNIQANTINNISNLCNNTYSNYIKEYSYYNSLVETWNKKYSGKLTSKEADLFNEKLNKQKIITKEKENIHNGCILTVDELQKQIKTTYTELKNIL